MRFTVLIMLVYSGHAQPSSPGDSPADADVAPIEFNLAFETAARAAKSGLPLDAAVDMASRVIEGEAPFTPIPAPTGHPSGWLYAQNWLSDSDARLLQHEVIGTDGWPAVGDLNSPRVLRLSAPLPPWCEGLAQRLAPALGHQTPDECVVHACETGQRTDPLELGEGTAAIVSLGSNAALLSAEGQDVEDSASYPFPVRSTVPLDARSVLLIARQAESPGAVGSWGHCVQSGGRHLSLIFRCSTSLSPSK